MAIQAGGIEAFLDLNTGRFDTKIKASQGKLDGFANKMQSAGGIMQSAGSKLTKGVTLPLAGVATAVLAVGADFESSMSEVEAISGATGAEMKMLEGVAREMGATTKFSASEAADGLKYMALAGWDTEEMATALPGVLDLAAASNTDLGRTSDIVTDALTAFNMTADDAEDFVDLLASTSSNANTDVEGLGDAFQYVAPVMGAVGITAEDTALALGIMADNGIKGSKAGTQLRTAVNNLISPTGKMQKTMDKYNIEVKKNEDGSIDLRGTMDNLRETIGDLDESQQAQVASTIFGKEAMAGMLAIINTGDEDYEKLITATTDYNGTAKEMAEIMQDNLQGSLEQMKSKLEEAGIALAESLIPMMEKAVEWIGNMVDKFNELDEEQKENIVKWGLILASAGPVLTIFGKITSITGTLASGVGTLAGAIGAGAGGAGLTGALALLGPLAIGGVAVAGVVGLNKVINDLKDDSVELEEVNVDVADGMMDTAKVLGESIGTYERLTEKSSLTNAEFAKLNELNKKISQSSNPGEIEELQKQYDRLAEKSGLTSEELEAVFNANENLLEQSPDVEYIIDEQGNKWVTSTEKAREYKQELLDISYEQLSIELEKALGNEAKLREENVNIEKEMGDILEEKNRVQDIYENGLEDSWKRVNEINEALWSGKLTQEESNILLAEKKLLNAIEKDDQEEITTAYQEYLGLVDEELDAKQEKLTTNEEELSQVDELSLKLADKLLMEQDIYQTGADGLAQLGDEIRGHEETIAQLEEKKKSAEGLTREENNQLENARELKKERELGLVQIFEETGLYGNLNDLVDAKLSLTEDNGKALQEELELITGLELEHDNLLGSLEQEGELIKDNIFDIEQQIGKTGEMTEKQRENLRTLDEKLGKQAEGKKALLEELGIWDELDNSTRENINSEIERGNEAQNTTYKIDEQGNVVREQTHTMDELIQKEIERNIEAGRDVDKVIRVTDDGTVETVHKEAIKPGDKIVVVDDNGTIHQMDAEATAPGEKDITVTDKTNSIGEYEDNAEAPGIMPLSVLDQDGTIPKFNRDAEEPKEKVTSVVDANGTIPAYNLLAEEPKNKNLMTVDQNGTISTYNRLAQEMKTKRVDAKDTNNTIGTIDRKASNPVTKTVKLVASKIGSWFGYADGTPPGGHPGGLAVVGDGGGRELITLPDGRTFLSPDTDTMLNLPKGTRVDNHRETAKMMRNIPKYANGTDANVTRNRQSYGGDNILNPRDIAKEIVSAMKDSGMTKPAYIHMDGRRVGEGVVDIVDRNMSKRQAEVDIGRGGAY